MATKVLAPSLGEGVDELSIVKWLKQEGEMVTELESLLEVETDKVVTEIPSPATGMLLRIIVPENGLITVGMIIAWIGQPAENIPRPDAAAPGTPTQGGLTTGMHEKNMPQKNDPLDTSFASRRSGFISPVVAKIAHEKNVDLNLIKGTGLGGRITKKDVLAFIESGGKPDGPGGKLGDSLIPHSLIRKAIAERMLLSKQTSPHVMTVMEVDISRVAMHRTENKDAFARDGIKLTFTAYFISAIVEALKAYPKVNSSWSKAGLVVHSALNIGVATSLGEDGLIVPVIKNADLLSLPDIARTVNDLVERARTNKLHPDEVKDGTFTLTNHGVSGSLLAMPIIYQPQSGILGVGKIQKRPVVVTDAQGNDSIGIRPMAYLSFVFDHRILDGIVADWFLSKVVESLESWK
jgi:pyruvate/2-oxoglutarate dehydrogenase complex dihydrolipoamide acyltransferase (E2) component